MRWLRDLIPDEVRNSLNQNTTFAWCVVVLGVVVGSLLVVKGVDAVRHKRLTGKDGRVFEGTTAQVLGVLYAMFGAFFVVFVILAKVVR
jgi:hypothetical protein